MKANSERVKGKNFRKLAEKPLFSWILDELLRVEEVDLIVINTDARDILKKNGLEENDRIKIRDRKKELCGDYVSMNLILKDDIENFDADYYVMSHTTNPMLTSKTIKHGIKMLQDSPKNDSLFSVNEIKTRFYDKDVNPVNHNPNQLVRTQDLEPWYEENSCLYIFTKESFRKTNSRIGSTPMMYVTPMIESIDIDEPEDWYLAEAIASFDR